MRSAGVPLVPGRLLWQPRLRHFPPGNHNLPSGLLHVIPRETPLGRYLTIQLRGNERIVAPMKQGTIISPARVRGVFPAMRRETRISIDLGDQVAVAAVLMPRDGSSIRLFADDVEIIPERSVIENLYHRTSGKRKEKTLNRLVLFGRRPSAEIHTSLGHFGEVFAVDTNRCLIDRLSVSITSVIAGSVVPVREADHVIVSYRHLRTWAGPVPLGADATELLGWMQAIALVDGLTGPAPTSGRVLIVDSNLGQLDELNARRLALPGGAFLPANWSLMYATSDAGSAEFLPNAMLASADRASRLARRELEQAGLPPIWYRGPA